MKKPTKSIITSSLLAVAFGALSVGSTFALFTSQSQTEINVESGIVNVESRATLVSYSSSVDGTVETITGNSYSNPLVGNSFGLEGNVVTIDKMVPGDSLTLKLSALNKSNVKTKTRLVINHATVGTKTDLYPALDLDFSIPNNGNPADLFKWTTHDAVTEDHMAEGVELYEDLTVTIAFPDGDNGEILFGDANHDNQYQDAACSIMFSLEAVQGNAATSPIDEINAYLAAEKIVEGQNKTMYEAVQDMAELNYGINILNYNNVNYIYSLDADQFVAENSVTSNYHRYFRVYSEMPGTQTFSIYAADDFSANEGAVALTGVGFDAGDSTGVMSVSYAGLGEENARTNIIRTNSLATAVTVNAPYDVVHHYGDAASVNIQAVASNSYHEFGNVAFTEIASGRIVLEEGSKTEQIHINKIADEQAFDTIIIANNGLSEQELPSKITRDQIEVQNEKELVVTVLDLREATVEPVYAYPYQYVEQEQTIPAGTTEKTSVQNTNVETPLGMKVIDSDHDGEKALAPAAKNEAKETAIEEVIVDNDYVAQISTKFYKSFNDAFEDVKNNDTLKVINDCNAWSRYNASGKNLTIEVKRGVTLNCGTVTNGKFEFAWNNDSSNLVFDGEGKITFTQDNTWGLVTKNGSNSSKAYFRNVTVESSAADGLLSDSGSAIVVESGLFKNITFINGQIIEGYEAKDTDSDGYYEIVEKDPAAGNIFELTEANNNKIYIAPGDVASMLAGENSIVTSGCTLKLLTDYTFSNVIYTSWSGLLYLSGSDVVLDLNYHSLTIDCSPSTYMLNIESSGSLTFMNGYIYTASTKDQKLFDGGYCDENNFHSINVHYGSHVCNPWAWVQMTPVA